MKKIFFSLVISIIFLSSCTGQNKDFSFKEDIVFKTGFYTNSFFCGNFYDKDSNIFFYFMEPTSRKEIQIFDKQQNLMKKISLKKIDYITMAKNISIPCMDSIIITIGNPLQLIYVLDSNANILYKRYFPKSYYISDSVEYEYGSIRGNHIYNNGNVYITNDAVLPYGNIEMFLKYLKKDYKELNFTKIKLDTSNNSQFRFGNYNDKIYKYETSYRSAIKEYIIENNYIFHLAHQRDKIVVIDINNTDSVKILTLKSKYTKIGKKDKELVIKDNLENVVKEEINLRYLTGNIFDVVWDRYRELYYFFVRTKHIKTKDFYKCDFIVQIYDKDLNFVRESILEKNTEELAFNDIVVLPEGLLINSNRYGRKENATKKTMEYKLYSINF